MSRVSRRGALKVMAAVGASAAAGCPPPPARSGEDKESEMQSTMSEQVVLATEPLAFPWQTLDPFLFCVHHDDAYPEGNERFGPRASLAGRNIGMDFEGKDGWRMYHGDVVPGFPQHPHRGFETVTVVRRGLLDHSDSLGAAARYGEGDVQWLTAGKGILHAEMFPLLKQDEPNPVELFQIWLNLPKADKFVEPHFSMLWDDSIPRLKQTDAEGRSVEVEVVAGALGEHRPPSPPPSSWASRPDADVAIWTLKMQAGASFSLPAAKPGSNRMLYFFRGRHLRVGGSPVPPGHAARLEASTPALLEAGDDVEALVLQGRPIGEPVVQHGPFVMNSREDIVQAFDDYRRTRFGGWKWSSDDPVHGREGRFARRPDGSEERPS